MNTLSNENAIFVRNGRLRLKIEKLAGALTETEKTKVELWGDADENGEKPSNGVRIGWGAWAILRAAVIDVIETKCEHDDALTNEYRLSQQKQVEQSVQVANLRIYIEHGWVCLRTSTGQLIDQREIDKWELSNFMEVPKLSAAQSEPTGEAVAWAEPGFEETMSAKCRQAHIDKGSYTHKSYTVPLYTHPETDTDALIVAVKEVLRISDRKHDAWDKAKELIAKIEAK